MNHLIVPINILICILLCCIVTNQFYNCVPVHGSYYYYDVVIHFLIGRKKDPPTLSCIFIYDLLPWNTRINLDQKLYNINNRHIHF